MVQELSKKKSCYQKNKNIHINKQKNNKKKFKKNYQKNFDLKKRKWSAEDIRIFLLKKNTSKFANYLHTNRKLKQGIFLRKPTFNDILYPFSLNLKLINEYLKKK